MPPIRDAALQPDPAAAQIRPRAVAAALETPGGLKVQTIHALCTRLLQQFPFEANVPARFTVLDDRDQTEMMERATLAVMLDASRAPDGAMGAHCWPRWQCSRRYVQGSRARGMPQPRSLHGLDRRGGSADAAAQEVAAARSIADDVLKTSIARSSTVPICPDRFGRAAAAALAASRQCRFRRRPDALAEAMRATDTAQV